MLIHEHSLVRFVTTRSVDASAVESGTFKVLPPYIVPSVGLQYT